MNMPGRTFSAGTSYRYGFNGKELDKEVAGTTTYDYGFRIYNPALGKFLSVDPLFKGYPWYTPYQYAGNKPIWCIDRDGMEEEPATTDDELDEESNDVWDEEQTAANTLEPVEIKPKKKGWWKSWGKDIVSGIVDFIPIVGDAKGYYETVAGKDPITGDKVSTAGRVINAVPIIGKRARTAGKVFKKVGDGIGWLWKKTGGRLFAKKADDVAEQVVKHSDEAAAAAVKWTGAMSKQIGIAGEENLQRIFGGVREVFERTSKGGRRWDVLADGVAYESKVGRTGLTKRVRDELSSDFELLANGKVNNVVWYFTTSGRTGKGGATQKLKDRVDRLNAALEAAGKNGRIELRDATSTTINLPSQTP